VKKAYCAHCNYTGRSRLVVQKERSAVADQAQGIARAAFGVEGRSQERKDQEWGDRAWGCRGTWGNWRIELLGHFEGRAVGRCRQVVGDPMD